jgi:hypothetical protein
MAARKKSTRKATRAASARRALTRLELPRNLQEFRKRIEAQLNALERDTARARTETRRRAARLIREASRQLGRLEAKGETGWRQLAESYRKELVRLLERIERALAPKGASRTVRKSGARVKKAAASAARAPQESAAS